MDLQTLKQMERPIGRLQWLIEFVQLKYEDIADLKDGSLTDMQERLRYFVIGHLRDADAHAGTTAAERLTRGRLWELREELRTNINSIDTSGWPDGLKRRLMRKNGKLYSRIDDVEFTELFCGCAHELVAAEGNRIRECARKGCGGLLVHTGRSTYCSPACSQTVRSNKWRRKVTKASRAKEVSNG